MLDAVLVKNSEGKWFRFQLWEDRIFIMDREVEYRSFDDFFDCWTEADAFDEEDGELRAMYIMAFGAPPPKNAKFVSIAKAVWCKCYLRANDRTDVYGHSTNRDPVTGAKERRRNLNGRQYVINEPFEGWTADLPEQAQIVYKALRELSEQVDSVTINEGAIKDLMTRLRDEGTLKTKQDPFRIFQYYRPTLKKIKLLSF